jgi:hypothetical protein
MSINLKEIMMRRTQTDFDGQETDRKTGNRPMERKQADRQIRRRTGNGTGSSETD